MTTPTKVALSIAVGLSGGAFLGLAMSNAHSDRPLWLVVLVYALACGPVLGGGFHLLVLDRSQTERTQRAAQDNVETTWAQRAGSTAWVATVTILIALSMIGQATGVEWLEQLGTAHVAIVGMGSWIISYLLIKRQES